MASKFDQFSIYMGPVDRLLQCLLDAWINKRNVQEDSDNQIYPTEHIEEGESNDAYYEYWVDSNLDP